MRLGSVHGVYHARTLHDTHIERLAHNNTEK